MVRHFMLVRSILFLFCRIMRPVTYMYQTDRQLNNLLFGMYLLKNCLVILLLFVLLNCKTHYLIIVLTWDMFEPVELDLDLTTSTYSICCILVCDAVCNICYRDVQCKIMLEHSRHSNVSSPTETSQLLKYQQSQTVNWMLTTDLLLLHFDRTSYHI